MGLSFPYTYVSCPCSDVADDIDEANLALSASLQCPSSAVAAPGHTQAPFDPRHPRSNFSLFPPDHLLYCEECRNVKCPRCITEEHVSYYCNSCLFETPRTAAASEGYRCSRNCFNCPICFSQLTVNSVDDSIRETSWILNCNYCMWTSLDIGIKFDRPTNVRAQLDKIANGGIPKLPSKKSEIVYPGRKASHTIQGPLSPKIHMADSEKLRENEEANAGHSDLTSHFAALKSFYVTQIANECISTDQPQPYVSGDFSYTSPASLVRILSMYSSNGVFPSSKKTVKPTLMREALHKVEGLEIHNQARADVITSRLSENFSNATSLRQRNFQLGPCDGNPRARFVDELRPMPAQLTTKNAKRCKDCKHILVKPDPKPTSTRNRIKLLALNYIPSVALKPLYQSTSTSGASAKVNPWSPFTVLSSDVTVDPGKTSQWILTLKNPLFDVVRVSLATPAVTPGKWGHRVTILCPQFEVGTNSDVWDEALNSKDRSRENDPAAGFREHAKNGGPVAEAGKVYDQGRNWTSVVLEIVPTELHKGPLEGGQEAAEHKEDEDILEIPIRVRLEWRQGELEDHAVSRKTRLNEDMLEDGRRELAYWIVVGVGRIRGAGTS